MPILGMNRGFLGFCPVNSHKKEAAVLSDSEKMVSYRIGEYARRMGVTPDFLKYYEQLGLVHSKIKENGYHYYAFNESYKILECMRLKSYGFSVREMEALFGQEMNAVQEKMEEQIRQLEERVAFQQRLIAEHRRLSQFRERLGERKSDWSIEWGEDMLFLPHSDGRNFLNDPAIYEILKDWIAQMPMVKSCMEIPEPWKNVPFSPDTRRFRWGMVVNRCVAEEIGLPVNAVVKQLPRRKLFQFYFSDTKERGIPLGEVCEKMGELGLSPKGNAYMTVFMNANIQNQPQRFGVLSVPIE